MRVALIGGTGFVGGYLTDALVAAGHEPALLVRAGSESKVRHRDRVSMTTGELASPEALRDLINGCDAVIYNVGILREFPRKGITFEATQYEGVVRTVDAAIDSGVRRLLLMSANGVKCPGTAYQETKSRAEDYALASGLDVTVLRPSVIFGDPRGTMEFATQLNNDMVRPPLPAVGFFSGWDPQKGAVVMSPVHIKDVSRCIRCRACGRLDHRPDILARRPGGGDLAGHGETNCCCYRQAENNLAYANRIDAPWCNAP